MKRYSIILFIFTLFNLPLFGQIKNDVEKDNLFGKVKSIISYKLEYGEKTDSTLLWKVYYNENGMKLKQIIFSEDSKVESIVNTYDKKNRLLSKIQSESKRDLSTNEIEKSIDTIYYEYNNKCENYAVLKNPKGTYRINYTFDENCRISSETKIGRGNTHTITYEYDYKDRLIKRTLTYLGEKPDKEETFNYDDDNNTLTNIEFDLKNNAYLEKTITNFNKNNKIVQKKFFLITAGRPLTTRRPSFSEKKEDEPVEIYLIKNYQYNKDDKLTTETHFDIENKEILKNLLFYDEKGELKEQKSYENGKLDYREEYKYENGMRVEKKNFLSDQKKPEYVLTFKFNNNKQIVEFAKLFNDNKFSNEFVYDKYKNVISDKRFENGKNLKTEFIKIEYYP